VAASAALSGSAALAQLLDSCGTVRDGGVNVPVADSLADADDHRLLNLSVTYMKLKITFNFNLGEGFCWPAGRATAQGRSEGRGQRMFSND